MSVLNNIHNYYEQLVLEALAELLKDGEIGEETATDIVCIALNHLPPRYIKHEVDLVYYMSPVERQEIRDKAKKAVEDALAYVNTHKRA